jgi:hypothetical protein
MKSGWLGLIELFVVLAFFIGWGVIELVARRYDRKREAERSAAAESSSENPP